REGAPAERRRADRADDDHVYEPRRAAQTAAADAARPQPVDARARGRREVRTDEHPRRAVDDARDERRLPADLFPDSGTIDRDDSLIDERSAEAFSATLGAGLMRSIRFFALVFALIAAFAVQSMVHTQSPASPSTAGPFDGLHFRPIGPAAMSGRFTDL